MTTMVRQAMGRLRGEGTVASLSRSAMVAILVQGVGLPLSYLLQLGLARWMGSQEYGLYQHALVWTMFLAVPAALGLRTTLIRFIPEYEVSERWGLLRGIVRQGQILPLALGGAVAVVGTAFVLWLPTLETMLQKLPFLLALWLAPLQALFNIQTAVCRAIRRIGAADSPTFIVRPVVLLGAAGALLLLTGYVSAILLIVVNAAVLLGAFAYQSRVFRRHLPPVARVTRPTHATREWLAVSMPLLLVEEFGLLLGKADMLMIGAFIGSESLGVYHVALRLAALVSFILTGFIAAVGPRISALYAQGNLAGLQRIASFVAHAVFWPSLAAGIVLIVFAEPMLQLFGTEFTIGRWPLVILVIGQLINTGTGAVWQLLALTGHHKLIARVVIWGAGINILLNAILIPLFGLIGAAIAWTVCALIVNVWMHQLVVHHVAIRPSIVSLFHHRS